MPSIPWHVGTHPPSIVVVIHLSVLNVQSANVERVCKAHGVIHTKPRNRLVNKSVQRLLFFYVNLCLLWKETSIVAKFLLSAIHDELDEVELDGGGYTTRRMGMEKTVHQAVWSNIVYCYDKLKHDLLLVNESLGSVKDIFVHKEVSSSHHSSTGNSILLYTLH